MMAHMVNRREIIVKRWSSNEHEEQALRTRVTSLDLLRVLGIVAVVATHAFYMTPARRLLLFTWQVPLFFVLSGYFSALTVHSSKM